MIQNIQDVRRSIVLTIYKSAFVRHEKRESVFIFYFSSRLTDFGDKFPIAAWRSSPFL